MPLLYLMMACHRLSDALVVMHDSIYEPCNACVHVEEHGS